MAYKMDIVYVWLGDVIPSRYVKRLEWITFPYKLIGDKQWQELATDFHKYNLAAVEKADILRVLYLQKYGGIYSDFDNILNYTCLMEMVSPLKGFYMAGE